MDLLNQNRIWIIGGSEGIGLELTKQLLNKGSYLVVSARKAEQSIELVKLQAQYPKHLALLNCDVSLKDEVQSKTNQAWSIYNGLDTWIYNAGTYHPMTLKEWDINAFDKMNQVNYLGAVLFMHALLPLFEKSHSSEKKSQTQWLWNISLASDFGLPYGGGYSAPKAALQNLAESLQPELEEANIQLKVVNHGFVKTRLTAKNDFTMMGLMKPDEAAKKIVLALQKNHFETRFPFSLASTLGIIKRLPKSWALKITRTMLHKG
ncbi:MAG TPA: SDR family NAD(P)-dependent oxidoreductase [Thiomicrospira sp.]|jgi:short-subunit dehydrogenase|nr:SDR family NAD(P)-dependent oxidoreductase [Thiomicrospira sp.]